MSGVGIMRNNVGMYWVLIAKIETIDVFLKNEASKFFQKFDQKGNQREGFLSAFGGLVTC